MAGYCRGSKEAGRVLGCGEASLGRLRLLGEPEGARAHGAAVCVGEGTSSRWIYDDFLMIFLYCV